MAATELTKTRMVAGVWEGVLTTDGDTPPEIKVTHLNEAIPDVTVMPRDEADGWLVQVPIPAERLSDGVQTFLIRNADTDETLNSFSLLAGDALSEDIRAEMDLLREELDMLKRAFRRHCVETM